MKIIAVAGATGLTGKIVIKKLLQMPDITQVIAIVRKATHIDDSKLQEVYLENGQLSPPIQADGFICCLGTTIAKAGTQAAFQAVDLQLPVTLGKALAQNGCKYAAVISSLGAAPTSRNFYLRTKGQMEQQMSAIGFRGLAFLRPSIIDGQRQEKRMGEKIGLALAKALSFLLVGPLRKYRPTPAEDIADGLITAVTQEKEGIHIVENIVP